MMIEVRCPYCNALQFKMDETAQIEVEVKCRGRKCGRFLRISNKPKELPLQIVEIPAKEAYKPVEHK